MGQVKDRLETKLDGWIPDLPDHRDYTLHTANDLLRAAVMDARCPEPEIDLSNLFPPVEDQGSMRSTTAFSCGSLIEYFNRLCRGKMSRVSKPFLYDVTRRLHGIDGDSGVSIRQALKTLVHVGVPPAHCTQLAAPQSADRSFDPLLYSFAADYRDILYIRVGSFPNRSCLQVIKSLIYLGMPCVFGMPIYSAFSSDPRIECRGDMDAVIGGATGVFVGFNDEYRISDRGALKFRSSWGPDWGESGYGWISYRMVNQKRIRDIWTVFSPTWLGRGDFRFG